MDTEFRQTKFGFEPIHITILDFNGNILLNEYLKLKGDSEGSASNLTSGPERKDYSVVKPTVMRLLKDKIIIGHELRPDFKVLQLPLTEYLVIDTAYIPELLDYEIRPKKLKHLAKQLLGRVIQPTFTPHNSKEDALAALNIVKTYKENITIDPKHLHQTKIVNPYVYPRAKFKKAKLNTNRSKKNNRNMNTTPRTDANLGLPRARKTRRSRKY